MKLILVFASIFAFQQFNSNTAVRAVLPSGADTCYTFTVDNASSDSLGDVTINGVSNYADFYVTATGTYQQTLCFAAVSATLAGTTVPFPNSANIQLASGDWITLAWSSPNLVEITNRTKANTPVQ